MANEKSWSGSLLLLLMQQLVILNGGLAQDCLRPADSRGRQIPFRDDNRSPRLPSGTQAIITSYKFHCCGLIHEWQTYVQPGGGGHRNGVYDITFQVWRPSPTVNSDGCYGLVGENVFTSITLGDGGLVSETPEPTNRITVQPGDVVGYFTFSRRNQNEGIQLDTSFSDEVVWYHTSTDPIMGRGDPAVCPFPVGSQSDRVLRSSTNAGPVLSVGVSSTPCSSSSSGVAAGVIVVILVITIAVISAVIVLKRRSIMKGLHQLNNNITEFFNPYNDHASSAPRMKKNEERTRVKVVTQTQPSIQDSETVRYESSPLDSGPADDKKKSNGQMIALSDGQGKNHHHLGPEYYKSSCSIDDADRIYHILEPEYASRHDYEIYEDPTVKRYHTGSEDAIFGSSGLIVPNQDSRKKSAKYQSKESYSKLNFFEDEHIYWTPAGTTSEIYDQLSAKKYREIPRKQIQILEHLGSGQFGTVSKGLWTVSNDTFVLAIKQLPPETSSMEQVKLLQEAAIMGQFSHRNVVKLYGLVTMGDPLMVCIEFMKNGDLRNFILSIDLSKDTVDGTMDIKCFFLRAMKEIAAGMKYLSRKSFVHRDLAARNILLNDSLTCKIGDFGMARDLMDEEYYTAHGGGKIPIKWTAPEALLYRKYSSDSDVWSYAIVLFEIWSMAKKPFGSLSNNEVMNEIKKGYCQPPPPGCPRAIYNLMVDCWNPQHEYRPKFAEICNYLEQPVPKLLYWSSCDSDLSPSVAVLGKPLETTYELYPDLQNKHRQS